MARKVAIRMQPTLRPGDRAGFSLLEIIAVMVVMALGAVLVLPGLNTGLNGLRLDSAARDMVTLMKTARSQAIAEQKVFRVMLKINPDQPADSYVYANEYEEEIKAFPFPAGVRILVTDPGISGRISFYPNGRSSGLQFTLHNEQGKALLVNVDPVTGFARLTRPEEGV